MKNLLKVCLFSSLLFLSSNTYSLIITNYPDPDDPYGRPYSYYVPNNSTQNYNNQGYYQQPYNNQGYYQQPYNNQGYYQQPYNNQGYYQQPYNNQNYYQQPSNVYYPPSTTRYPYYNTYPSGGYGEESQTEAAIRNFEQQRTVILQSDPNRDAQQNRVDQRTIKQQQDLMDRTLKQQQDLNRR